VQEDAHGVHPQPFGPLEFFVDFLRIETLSLPHFEFVNRVRRQKITSDQPRLMLVTLRVTPFLRIECKFWLTDDGWNGSCAQPSINFKAGSFEHANSKWKWRWGSILSPLYAKPNHQAQFRLRKDE